jgi:hypothetical protein
MVRQGVGGFLRPLHWVAAVSTLEGCLQPHLPTKLALLHTNVHSMETAV